MILKVEDVAGKIATKQTRVTVLQDAPKADAGKNILGGGGRPGEPARPGFRQPGDGVDGMEIGAGAFAAVSKGRSTVPRSQAR